MTHPDFKESSQQRGRHIARHVHLIVLAVLQSIMVFELVLLVSRQAWMHSVLVVAIMATTLGPELFRRQFPVRVPPEFQVLAILFIFAALFLGEVRDYYGRLWWWDLALHASAGLLLGMLGFLLIYLLNEDERVDLHMRPSFMALFSYCFAIAVGTVWEIFEFAMDQIFGTIMQKPMMGDPSGLTDTMWDLIVNSLGALVVCIWGWLYLKRGRRWLIEPWIADFARRNPRLFSGDVGKQ